MKRFGFVYPIVIAISLIISTLFFVPTNAESGQLREIVLNDGSIIMAEVVSLKNGVYTLHSKTLGKMVIDDTKIRTIRSPGGIEGEKSVVQDKKDSAQTPSKHDIEEMQKSLIGSPNLVSMIISLQSDSEVQNILQDDEIMNLIRSGDMKALEANPKIRKLMANPKIQTILKQTEK